VRRRCEKAAEVDALHEQAVAPGARIVRPTRESSYYFYNFSVQDRGKRWEIGTDGRLRDLREQQAGRRESPHALDPHVA